MKFRVRKAILEKAFAIVADAVSKQINRPEIQSVRIDVRESKEIVLSATDGAIGVRISTPQSDSAFCYESGSATAIPKLARSIFANSDDAFLDFESDSATLHISGENANYRLATVDASKIPEIKEFDATNYHEIKASVLLSILRRASFCVDDDNSHYALGGVLFVFESEALIGVSTDSRRLARQLGVAVAVGNHSPEFDVIVPSQSARLLLRALPNDESTVKINASEGRAVFSTGATTIETRLIDGRFPAWRSIIPPKAGKSSCRLIAGSVLNAVKQADIVATEKRPGVLLTFGKNELCVAASGEETGTSAVKMPVDYDGDERSLRFDSRFLLDAFRQIDAAESVTTYFEDDKPCLFETDDEYQYVVMPLL